MLEKHVGSMKVRLITPTVDFSCSAAGWRPEQRSPVVEQANSANPAHIGDVAGVSVPVTNPAVEGDDAGSGFRLISC